jgi:hypothetical protein
MSNSHKSEYSPAYHAPKEPLCPVCGTPMRLIPSFFVRYRDERTFACDCGETVTGFVSRKQ